MSPQPIRLLIGAAVAAAALVLAIPHVRAQAPVEVSNEARFQLDLHVNDAALAAALPAGFTPNVATQGPAKDCNLRAIFVDRTTINGPDDLRRALVARPDHQFVQTLTENLLTYALGRSLDYHDMPAVRRIVRQAGADDYRFKSIVLGVVSSDAFRKREGS